MNHPFWVIERKDGDMSTGFKPIRGLTNTFGSIPLVAIAVLVHWFFASIGSINETVTSFNGVPLTGGMLALTCAGLVLPFEIAKSADTGTRGQIDLALSVLLFCATWLLFFTTEAFRTEYFLILCLLQTADAIGGGTVAILSARRDFATGA